MNKLTLVDISTEFNSPLGQTKGVNDIVSVLLNSAIAIAGVILLFLLIGGGLKIITGAGNSDPKSTADGKQAVTYALIGFIIVFTAYWIVRIIELIIGVPFVTAPGFVPGTGGV